MYSGGWKEAAFHSEVFHKRLFTKPVEAILLGTDYAKELLAKPKALINSAYTAMHTLLDHCYGTVVGERYVEEKFRQTAVSLATRYAQLHEGERQEILLHFPVVSSVLLNGSAIFATSTGRSHCSLQMAGTARARSTTASSLPLTTVSNR